VSSTTNYISMAFTGTTHQPANAVSIKDAGQRLHPASFRVLHREHTITVPGSAFSARSLPQWAHRSSLFKRRKSANSPVFLRLLNDVHVSCSFVLKNTEPDYLRTFLAPEINIKAITPTTRGFLDIFI